MKKTKKMIRNLILFILLIILTFWLILKDQDVTQIFNILGTVKQEFILIAIMCMCIFLICDAINIGRGLKALGEKSSFSKNIKYALIGFFFSSITPAATGGQPMQIYYMHKNKITVANATLTFLMNLTCVQIVTISMALFSLIFNFQYMNRAMAWFFIIGITLNSSALALLLISIISKRMSKALIDVTLKILKFFRVKNIEEKEEKFKKELNRYYEGAKYIKANRKLMLKTLLTTYLQYIFYYSISYFVYCSFGLSQHNIFQMITTQSVLYATVSGIPSPGAVGVSEGGFLALYSAIYPDNTLSSAMLLCRGVNFYLFVIISSVVVCVNIIRDKKEEKTEDSIQNVIEENKK